MDARKQGLDPYKNHMNHANEVLYDANHVAVFREILLAVYRRGLVLVVCHEILRHEDLRHDHLEQKQVLK